MFLTPRASRRTPNLRKGNRLKDIHCRNGVIGGAATRQCFQTAWLYGYRAAITAKTAMTVRYLPDRSSVADSCLSRMFMPSTMAYRNGPML